MVNITQPPSIERLGTVGECVEILVGFISSAQPSIGEALNDFGPLAEGLMASYARQTLATQQQHQFWPLGCDLGRTAKDTQKGPIETP